MMMMSTTFTSYRTTFVNYTYKLVRSCCYLRKNRVWVSIGAKTDSPSCLETE